jgi:hypothetical protein
MTIWRKRIECWIPKATNTGCVILTAFPEQQWLKVRASMLRFTHITCFVIIYLIIAFCDRNMLQASNYQLINKPKIVM